jgi:hypothetical protein
VCNGIITATRRREECDLFFALWVFATCTTIVITSAWIAMLRSRRMHRSTLG